MNGLKRIEERILTLGEERKADKIVIVTDETVDKLAPDFLTGIPRITLKCGEENKSISQAEAIWNFLEAEGATRKTITVNLGGGMVTDLGGFAASTFKRGIPYINVATTVLAAVDAAIGGKTGINYAGLKNEIGVFALPVETLIAGELFNSLPRSEILSGYGEMLKTGLLDSESLYKRVREEGLIENPSSEAFDCTVRECADFKQQVVNKDFREGGLRKILNLGHTVGHAFEMITLEKGMPAPHGVAIAYGILTSLILSRFMLEASSDLMYSYLDVLKRNFPKISIGCGDVDRIIDLIGHDKKNTAAGRPKFVLLKAPGEPVVDMEPTKEEILSALEITFDHIN